MKKIFYAIVIGSMIFVGIHAANSAKTSIENLQSSRMEMLNSIN